jgi:hypothetical protein
LNEKLKTQKTTEKTFKSAQLTQSNFTAWMKTTTHKFSSQEPRCNSSATTAQQLLDYTATACCIQQFNLSSSPLTPFGCNKVTTSIKEVFVIPV